MPSSVQVWVSYKIHLRKGWMLGERVTEKARQMLQPTIIMCGVLGLS